MGITRNRRLGFLMAAFLAAAITAGCGSTAAPVASEEPTAAPISPPADVSSELAQLELEYDARLGVSAVDTGTGRILAYRDDERFGYASTLKVFAAAELLRLVPVAERDTIITWTEADLGSAGYSPVASEHLDEGLSLAKLAEAAVRESDNTAMNLILEHLGGPAALDAGLMILGDEVTEVADDEPELNTIEPDSIDDTTTAAAFTGNLGALFVGDTLTDADQQLLAEWMSGNATGDDLIRAESWIEGSGTCRDISQWSGDTAGSAVMSSTCSRGPVTR